VYTPHTTLPIILELCVCMCVDLIFFLSPTPYQSLRRLAFTLPSFLEESQSLLSSADCPVVFVNYYPNSFPLSVLSIKRISQMILVLQKLYQDFPASRCVAIFKKWFYIYIWRVFFSLSHFKKMTSQTENFSLNATTNRHLFDWNYFGYRFFFNLIPVVTFLTPQA